MNWYSFGAGVLILALCVPTLVSRQVREGHQRRWLRLNSWAYPDTAQKWAVISTWSWAAGGALFGAIFAIVPFVVWCTDR